MKDYAIDHLAVETSELGRHKVLQTVGDLALYLLQEWPDDPGEKHRAAQIACLDALEGKISPNVARIAFLEAAEENKVWTLAPNRPASTGTVERWRKYKPKSKRASS